MDLMQPHMPPVAFETLRSRLARTTTFLEFGAGGSTVLAAQQNVSNIISLDSSKDWLDAVSAQISNLPWQGNLYPIHADIGDVAASSWGYPTDESAIAKWHLYYSAPWMLAQANNLTPDLVLVDGRFRVCCFLISLLSMKPGVSIFFDDYTDRPEYHLVESVLRPIAFHDHMAEFRVEHNLNIPMIVTLLFKNLHVLD